MTAKTSPNGPGGQLPPDPSIQSAFTVLIIGVMTANWLSWVGAYVLTRMAG
jgi:hypothetical protein